MLKNVDKMVTRISIQGILMLKNLLRDLNFVDRFVKVDFIV